LASIYQTFERSCANQIRKGSGTPIEIIPYYGNQPLSVGDVFVRVNPEDRKRAEALIVRTSAIQKVEDQDTFRAAKSAAGSLKALLNEIEASKKASKQPFSAIAEAINQQAIDVGSPVATEHRRILDLLNDYVTRLEEIEAEKERARKAEAERIQAEHDRKIREAEAAQHEAEARARAAQDEAERQRARAEANAQMLVATQEQLAREIALEVAQLGNDRPRKGLVAGGRVDHNYDFKLLNLRETINAGCINLLRWELDIRACQDSVRAQLAIDPNREPTLPGIEVKRRINVSVKASARVV
jgi:hypothetical protein